MANRRKNSTRQGWESVVARLSRKSSGQKREIGAGHSPAVESGKPRRAKSLGINMNIIQEKKCKHCGIIFIPKKISGNHKGIYCSKRCFIEDKKVIPFEKECINCGTKFFVKKEGKKFYNTKCASKFRSKEKNYFWNGGKELRECVICESKFEEFPSVKKNTCSEICSKKLASVKSSNSNNPNWKGGELKKCKVCSNTFWCCPSRTQIFCSKDCFYKDNFSRSSARYKSGSRWGAFNSKSGKRADIGIFVRSAWEANYARYLNFLIEAKKIKQWSYEKETFYFENIKRGTRSYTPDFKVELLNGDIEYHEVKGWMHPKGKTALSRMKKYHPKIKIVLIQKKEYEQIKRQLGSLIKNWE